MIIESKVKTYRCEFVRDILSKREELFAGIKFNRPFYLIDKNFFALYEKPLQELIQKDFYLVIDAHENNKEYVKLADYYKALIEAGFQRSDCLVTFGGGILQDISGFIASTLYRGLQWVFVPTTLLAQADSCIGSKTSINFGESKNLIGTFYPPDLIAIDVGLCKTLPQHHLHSGVGEIIKFHLLSDPKRYDLLQKFLAAGEILTNPYFEDIIISTLEIKKSYFEADEFDTGRRNLLNYGHSFGHALESASNFAVAHGEAVVFGMGFANLLSLKRGLMKESRYQEFETLLRQYYPPFNLHDIGANKLIHYLKKDKKRTGKDLTLILGRDIGDFDKYSDVKEEEVVATFNDFVKTYPLN